MIEAISTKILDILAADSRLYAGGNAFAAGWTGVKREDDGDTPTAGYINLFDKSYELDGTGHRPAVYLGTKGIEATDRLDFPVCVSAGRFEYRIMVIPLYVCCQADTKTEAKRQRNQLRRNILAILFGQIVVSGFWYDLQVAGADGGVIRETISTSGTGGGSQAVCEGVCLLPVQVRYSFNASCDA